MAGPRVQGLGLRSKQAPSRLRARRRRHWALEGLEERIVLQGTPTVYTVDLATDAGTSTGPDSGDLLYVITQANANSTSGGSEIQFDPTVFNAAMPQTITLTAPLALQETGGPEVIDGPGAAVLTISGGNANQVFSVAAGSTASIAGLSISGGNASGNGGGIDNAGTLTLSNLAITGNTATSGGGIQNEVTGVLTLSGCTLSANTANGPGGGIDNAGTLSVTNSTLTGNSAITGGAIWSAGPGTFINATVAYNNVNSTSDDGGGMYLTAGSSTALYNTIVVLNTAGTGLLAPANDIDNSGGGSLVPTSANNLIGKGGAGGLVAGGDLANQIGVTDPGLDTGLKSNGGPTQTIALVEGSPAIDAGSASIVGVAVPTVDQRGALRGPLGINAGPTVDIGAYEASSSYLVSSLTDTAHVGTIATAVGWANLSTNANPANLIPPPGTAPLRATRPPTRSSSTRQGSLPLRRPSP